MSLGLFASIAAIFRTIGGMAQDPLRRNAEITLLAIVEAGLGVIAATLPTLKNFFESCLRALRVILREEPTEEKTRAKLYEAGLLDEMYEKGKRQWSGDVEKGVSDIKSTSGPGGNGIGK